MKNLTKQFIFLNQKIKKGVFFLTKKPFAVFLLSLPVLMCACLFGTMSGCNTERASIPYQPGFKPLPVQIVPVNQIESASAPTVLARLDNQKLALKVRDDAGKMKPFYVRGIETGFYDTRNKPDIDWDQVFAGYRLMGANTSLFMVHWQDIEPEPGKYDFAFMDRIVATAKKYNVKIWWVLFMRCSIGDPVSGANAWVYRFLNKDSADHSIQWIKTKRGKLLNRADEYVKAKTRIYPEYAHPKVFSHIMGMMDAVGKHYRNSPDVLGLQIGNEEGFNDAGEGDFNPAALALFEEWKKKTGKSDTIEFKLDINKYWWQQFTTAFHRADPYKVTSYNLHGGSPEAENELYIKRMGVDASIYGDANIDVIGTMFYGKNGLKIWPNLDRHYENFVYQLPILVPSEIGLGKRWGPQVQFQTNAIHAIERGGQGYSAYCYGELVDSVGQPNAFGQFFRKFGDMVQANEDIIYAGVPGSSEVSMEVAVPGAKLSQLHRDADGTLGILFFPEAYTQQYVIQGDRAQPRPDANPNAHDVTVDLTLKAVKNGKYKIEIYRDGALQSSEIRQLERFEHNPIQNLTLTDVKETEAVFIKITRAE